MENAMTFPQLDWGGMQKNLFVMLSAQVMGGR